MRKKQKARIDKLLLGEKLFSAMVAKEYETAEALIKQKAYLERADTGNDTPGFTAIHFAVRDGADEMLRLLVESGANVNQCCLYQTIVDKSSNSTKIEVLQPNSNPVWRAGFVDPETQTVTRQSSLSPLMLAIKDENLSATRILLKNGAKIQTPYESSFDVFRKLAIPTTTKAWQCLEALIENQKKGPGQVYLRFYEAAVKQGNNDMMTFLGNPAYGLDPLHCAVLERNASQIATVLQDKKGVYTTPDDRGRTPVYVAAEAGRWSLVKAIATARKGDTSDETQFGYALLFAMVAKEYETAEALIKQKAYLERADTGNDTPGFTAIYFAVRDGANEMLRLLVESGANVHPRCLYQTIFDKSSNSTKTNVLQPNAKSWEKEDFIEHGNQTSRSKTLDVTQHFTLSPLMLAMKGENLFAIQILLNNGARLANPLDTFRKLPIPTTTKAWQRLKALIKTYKKFPGQIYLRFYEAALKQGNEDMPAFLSDPAYGLDPLHCAVLERNVSQIVTVLQDKEGVYTTQDYRGRTPIYVAAEAGRWSLVKAIATARKGDTSDETQFGYALLFAMVAKEYETAEALIKQKAYLERADTDTKTAGFTAIHFAVRDGANEVLKLLVSSGADVMRRCLCQTIFDKSSNSTKTNVLQPNADRWDKRSFDERRGQVTRQYSLFPLMLAIKGENLFAIQILLNNGARLANPLDTFRKLPIPTTTKAWQCLKALIKTYKKFPGQIYLRFYEAALKQGNEDMPAFLSDPAYGLDPLHCTLINEDFGRAKELLADSKTDIFVKDAQGQTVLEAAKARGNYAFAEIIKDMRPSSFGGASNLFKSSEQTNSEDQKKRQDDETDRFFKL